MSRKTPDGSDWLETKHENVTVFVWDSVSFQFRSKTNDDQRNNQFSTDRNRFGRRLIISMTWKSFIWHVPFILCADNIGWRLKSLRRVYFIITLPPDDFSTKHDLSVHNNFYIEKFVESCIAWTTTSLFRNFGDYYNRYVNLSRYRINTNTRNWGYEYRGQIIIIAFHKVLVPIRLR